MKINAYILYNFFLGKSSLEEEQAIKDWLDASSENKAYFLTQRKLFDSLLIHTGYSEPNGNTLIKKSRVRSRRNIIFREFLKIASVVTVVISSSLYYIKTKEDKLTASMQIVSVPSGQRANVTLPDGTNIWLNAETKIEYPLSFSKKERLVKLEGQAYFEVAHDKSTPFIVETKKGRINVLGTKFDVMAYPGEEFETALIEGKVNIILESDNVQSITLSPGNKACLNNGKLELKLLENYNDYRWVEGLICFENEPFTDIMKDLERCFGTKIKVNNDQLSERSYTGKFRYTDGLDYALHILKKDYDFSFERDNQNNILYIN